MSTLDWSGAINIVFDLPILSEVEVITGTEYFEVHPAPETARVFVSSGDNASYPKANAFDGDTATYWGSSSTTAPQWIGRNFSAPVQLTKVSARFDYSSGRPNAYQLQGSSDGVTWYDVAAGNFANASGWQDVAFAATTYQYWRLYFTSKYSSYYTCSELMFYGTRNVYDVAGWSVTADEPLYSPAGALGQVTYTIRKITKSGDNLTLTLWLDMVDRMRAPQGLVVVHYDQLTGGLLGPGNMAVESFDFPFSPSGLTPAPNPGPAEYLTARAGLTVSSFEVTYLYYKSADEYITATAGMTVVVTKVGELPL